ncbi:MULTISPECIES: carbohydrate ABC transporter permease [Enterocloster]|uniref:Carbohydrate ABC transporter membrane protein 2, CUT1 family n=4 Tax=Enterocloster TaxID=2719313 RepID=A0A1I0DXA1_9FIRM|nr:MULTISPECIES: carbohydrate ABC transporter permease [Enterocloster]RHR54509.1 carbohydrate ABC transporter permease [Clostridium sp. AF18-27]EEG55573.1 ABC transporter, permease protein [[Clostridium] asparagiforme DSM 15981]MBS5606391.1 carbohydrate ABC transporter permease [Enterocloster asparagiformis]MCB6344126.1 carbohydrate ABC transporter permease [Enterocloster lavalensis]PST34549.1 carbohydrate ABC transporter permease [Enterocloster lavalensis]
MNNGAKNIVTRVIDLVMKCLLVVIMVFPFYWMVITAFKTQKESMIFPPTLIPSQITFESFSTVMEKIPFGLFFKNSLIIALSVVLLQFIVVVPAAYGFAKYNFRCKNLFFAFVLLGFMLPQQITFAPSYLMFNKVGLLNSYAPMIIPFIGNAFGIFLLRQYFLQIPQEIIEAARLDDASEWKIIVRIMIPMARTAISSIGLLSFISSWNSYFWPLVMTSNNTYRTLPIGVTLLTGSEGASQWPIVMAGNLMMVLPILVVYGFASGKIRKAFVYSGIK